MLQRSLSIFFCCSFYSTALALRGKDGVVFAVEYIVKSKLYEQEPHHRIFNIGRHIGMATAGLIADGTARACALCVCVLRGAWCVLRVACALCTGYDPPCDALPFMPTNYSVSCDAHAHPCKAECWQPKHGRKHTSTFTSVREERLMRSTVRVVCRSNTVTNLDVSFRD